MDTNDKKTAHVCQTCNYWISGMCSCPAQLNAHLAQTGETVTYVLSPATGHCTAWLFDRGRVSHEMPGPRAGLRTTPAGADDTPVKNVLDEGAALVATPPDVAGSAYAAQHARD
jgi:hypothetical protein